MARKQPFAFIGGSYDDDTRPWSVQDTVNYLPVPAEQPGTRSEIKLKTPPGLREFTLLNASPVRGARNVEGALFVVMGTTVYQVSPSGVGTVRGNIPGVGPVSISHNQINGGNEVTFVNGNAGYVWNTVTATYTQITDDAFPGSIVVDYIDQYMVHVEPGRRYWFHSELASATSFNALDRYEAESSPDLITTLIVANSQVIVFGERTIQFFQNTGAATNTFVTSSNTVVELGCDAPYSVARIVNTVIFKSTDGSVYALNGNTPQRISTRPIEQALSQCDPRNMIAYTWEDKGHKVYYLTCPDGLTWGYDFTTGLWHRRQSYTYDRWRLNTLTLWNRAWYGGDAFAGRLWQLNWDEPTEGGMPFVSERAGPVLSSTQNRVTVHEVEFVMDTGQGVVTPVPPVVVVGDAPSAAIGIPYTFTYTASGGDGGPYTFFLLSGTLPPGITLSAAGQLTGAATETGTFVFSVAARDSSGNSGFVADSIDVNSQWWLMTSSGGAGDANIYLPTDPAIPATFPNAPTPRVPASTNASNFFGPIQSDTTGTVLVVGVTQVERITDFNPAGGYATTLILHGQSPKPEMARCINGIFFLFNNTASYRYSIDDGLTWVTYTDAGTRRFRDIARLGARWVTFCEVGATQNYVFSDQAVPTVWTLAATSAPIGGSFSNTKVVATSSAVCCYLGANVMNRTTDGTNWSSSAQALPAAGNDMRDSIGYGSVMIVVGQPVSGNRAIIRSTDHGATWQQILTPNLVNSFNKITRGFNDVLMLTGAGNGAANAPIFYSLDDGATWIQCVPPFPTTNAQPWRVCAVS